MPAERPDEGGVVLRLDYVSDSTTPRRVVPVGVCPVCKGCRNNVLEVP